MSEDRQDCCFDSWARANAKRAKRRETAAKVTGSMLAALEGAGLAGRTVLDVGCGTGDLTLATLAHGATSATGVDLGTGAIEGANDLARERGLGDRARFVVADGSTELLPKADVVVLHRVLCCFRDARGLLENTLGVTGAVFAMTAPVDRGIVGLYNRGLGALGNVWYRLRNERFNGFRVYHHDLEIAEQQIVGAGFRPVHHQRTRLVWDLRVYARPVPEEVFASS